MQAWPSQIIWGMKSSNNNSIDEPRFFAVIDSIRYGSKDSEDHE